MMSGIADDADRNIQVANIVQTDLSIIIPAFDEAGNLPRTLGAIRSHVPADYTCEVIVVDHGSTDATAAIAASRGARVVTVNGGTIAGLRNRGARAANGKLFIFLDADVELTADWGRRIGSVIEELSANPGCITGSVCGVPDRPGLIGRYWFKPLQTRKTQYINSGHLITSRELFEKIAGFDERLATGEDYDFAARARRHSAEIVNDPRLRVIHYGYPSTLSRFIAREKWHGQGDCDRIASVLRSKVALASLLLLMLHVALVVSLLTRVHLWVAAALVLLIAGQCVVSALYRHKQRMPFGIALTAGLYYVYYLSRAVSCLMSLAGVGPRRAHR